MSSIQKIKRGKTIPVYGEKGLVDGQLGYDEVGLTLYIGSKETSGVEVIGGKGLTKEIKQKAEAAKLAADDAKSYAQMVDSEMKQLLPPMVAEITELKRIDTLHETGILSARTDINKLNDETVPALQSSIDTNSANISTLTSDVATNKQNITALTTRVGTNETSISTINESLIVINNDIEAINTDISELQKVDEQHTESIGTINDKIVDIESDIQTIDGNITTIKSDISALQTADAGFTEDITNINVDIAEIETEITSINESITNLETADEGLDTRVTALETRVDEIDNDIIEINNRLDALEAKDDFLENEHVDRSILRNKIALVRTALLNIAISAEGKELVPGTRYITEEEKLIIDNAITFAEGPDVLEKEFLEIIEFKNFVTQFDEDTALVFDTSKYPAPEYPTPIDTEVFNKIENILTNNTIKTSVDGMDIWTNENWVLPEIKSRLTVLYYMSGLKQINAVSWNDYEAYKIAIEEQLNLINAEAKPGLKEIIEPEWRQFNTVVFVVNGPIFGFVNNIQRNIYPNTAENVPSGDAVVPEADYNEFKVYSNETREYLDSIDYKENRENISISTLDKKHTEYINKLDELLQKAIIVQ